MTIRVALAAFAIIAGIATAEAGVGAGQAGRLKEEAIACPTVDGLLNLISEKDQWKAGMQALADKCVVIKQGELVRVSKEPGRFTCFTTVDHKSNCLWVPTDYITPIE